MTTVQDRAEDSRTESERGEGVGTPVAQDVPEAFAAMAVALRKAAQLASIASDWNLYEVEIDGEMVPTYELEAEFNAVIAKAEGRS